MGAYTLLVATWLICRRRSKHTYYMGISRVSTHYATQFIIDMGLENPAPSYIRIVPSYVSSRIPAIPGGGMSVMCDDHPSTRPAEDNVWLRRALIFRGTWSSPISTSRIVHKCLSEILTTTGSVCRKPAKRCYLAQFEPVAH